MATWTAEEFYDRALITVTHALVRNAADGSAVTTADIVSEAAEIADELLEERARRAARGGK